MKYTPQMLEFLRAGYLQMRVPELTVAFNEAFSTNKSTKAIKSCLTNHKFTCGRLAGIPKGSYQLFGKEQADFMRTGYTELSIEDLTEALNTRFSTQFTAQQVRSFTRNHKLKSGRTGQFEPGKKSWNSGKKGWHAGGRSIETRFKPGRAPQEAANYRPIGSTRISKDGYLERKVSDDRSIVPARRWVAEHRLVWEAANGPIPKGHVVVFLDGDRLNRDIRNLRCVARGVLQYLNKMKLNNTAGEARKAALLAAEVLITANRRARA